MKTISKDKQEKYDLIAESNGYEIKNYDLYAFKVQRETIKSAFLGVLGCMIIAFISFLYGAVFVLQFVK